MGAGSDKNEHVVREWCGLSNLEELTNDYSREPVPDDQLVSGWNVATVIFSVGITLPIFYLGSDMGARLGLQNAAIAFTAGCLMLGVLACFTGYVGAKTRLSSYMIIEFCFGRTGARFVNWLMAIALLGYYGATADIFGTALEDAFANIIGWHGPQVLYTFAGSLLMTLTAIFGYNAISKLSIATVPLMSAFLAFAVYLAVDKTSVQYVLQYKGLPAASLGVAISTVLGSSIQMSVLMPDVSRFARSGFHGILSVSGLAIGYPLIFLAAAISTIATGEHNIMRIMIGLGIAIPALLTLIFSTWTTNTANLYSTTLTLATIFTRLKDWKITLGSAVVGTTLAMAGIMEHFISFLTWLGITTPPIAGVYLVDYFLVSGRSYDVAAIAHRPAVSWPAMAAWVGASLIGYLSSAGMISITHVAGVDSLVAAGILYYLFSKGVPVVWARKKPSAI